MTHAVLRPGALDELPALINDLGSEKVLVVCGPSKRHVDDVVSRLSAVATTVAAVAKVHVPQSSVDAAQNALKSFGADTVLSVGGGAATGLAKALRLRNDIGFIAVPTTYAGSEMTNIYGVTDGSNKKTGRDESVVPEAVVYDPNLTVGFPVRASVTSLLNAMAHPVSAASTGDVGEVAFPSVVHAARACLFTALRIPDAPKDVGVRTEALDAARQAGSVLAENAMGTHHRLAHALGGRFNLPHSELHAVLLPHTMADLRNDSPETYARFAEATEEESLPAALLELLKKVTAPTSLQDLKVTKDDLTKLLSENPDLPESRAWSAFEAS